MSPDRSWISVLLAGALVMSVPATDAAELGEHTVRSHLGQPLDTEIQIRSLEPGEEKTLGARLASPAAFRRAGIGYNRALDGSSAAAAPDGRRTRAYTLLLDPVGYEPAVPAAKPGPPLAAPAKDLPLSREALIGVPATERPAEPVAAPVVWRGFVQNYTAYDYKDPSHWSRAVIRTQLGAQGGGSNLKWKASARLDVDPVYAGGDFYPPEVRRDQKRDFFLRETYLDTSVGGIDLRLGKQNIVWGEMVGLFFADVVSARDQRDFILPDFEIIRIPQWALRAERFGDGTHAEVIWLPFPEVDIIGKPGAEFFPFQAPPPAGFTRQLNPAERPQRTLRHSNIGLRGSMLRRGWDLAAFYYRSTDVNPTFYRDVVLAPTPTLVHTPRHDRIWQLGGTLGKDFGIAVFKAETIYTSGRKFNVSRLSEPQGVVPQDTFDYVVGLDFALPRDARLNLQYFDRVFRHHDPDLFQKRREGGVSLLLAGKFGAAVEPELLIIQSMNRSDRLVRAKLGWRPARNLRLVFGADVFSGPLTGLFGRFDGNDRAYFETRYSF